MTMPLHRWLMLRRLALGSLRALGDHDIHIAHAWQPHRRMLLHLYRHKGYWYHGRNREGELMRSLQYLVEPGMRAVEVGGHIGWITVHLAELVGPWGTVEVLEPSPANLPYLRANSAAFGNVRIVEAAASDREGTAAFYLEDLTGQNDTLVQDYQVFEKNRALAFADSGYTETVVRTVRLDVALPADGRAVDLVKIDVEGAEHQVLQGARLMLEQDRPILAIEITRDRAEVLAMLAAAGYRPFTQGLRPVDPLASAERDFIFLHPARHAAHLAAASAAAAAAA